MIRSLFQILRKGVVLLLGIALLYLLFACIGMLIQQHRSFTFHRGNDSITIYVTSNGFHSSLIVPTQITQHDWSIFLCQPLASCTLSNTSYLGFGWGDRAFFAETPTWKEVSPGKALRAAFLPTPSSLQVLYFYQKPTEDLNTLAIEVSPETYQALCTYITASFRCNESKRPIKIEGIGRTGQYTFYEAQKPYHLFYTCNNWINQGLKAAQIRSGIWTPLDFTLLYPLKKIKTE